MNNITIYFILVPFLALLLLFLNFIFSSHSPYEEKISPYECGFIGYTEQTRNTYSVQFYNIAMLFLIFDLEILLVFPASLALYEIGPFGFTIMTVFFSLLTIGFVLEIGSGAISLSNYDNFNNKNKD